MVNHYAILIRMPSQHENPSHAFRPAAEEWDPAEEILASRSITPGEFLRACLRWLASDPDGVLAVLAPHWPARRATGRPRKKPGGNS